MVLSSGMTAIFVLLHFIRRRGPPGGMRRFYSRCISQGGRSKSNIEGASAG